LIALYDAIKFRLKVEILFAVFNDQIENLDFSTELEPVLKQDNPV
jgi:hypothetical protein